MAMSDVRGWFICSSGYIILWLGEHSTMVWKNSGEGGNRHPWWKFGHSMAPRIHMKSVQGGSMTREEAGSSMKKEAKWGNLEYGCINEE